VVEAMAALVEGGGGSGGGGSRRLSVSGAMVSSVTRTSAVILAGSSGSRLFPLTTGKPKALLPIANTPCLGLLLACLERNGFREVFLVTTEDFREMVSSFLTDFEGAIAIHLEVNPDTVGTADAIRTLYRENKLKGESVLVIPGECVVERQVHDLLDKHQRTDADLTILMVKEPPPQLEKGKKGNKPRKRDEEDIEFVGLAQQDRIIFKKPLVAVEEELTIPKTLLARTSLTGSGSKVHARSNLTDTQTLVLSRWVLELLDADDQFKSIKNDLVPYLIRRQLHSLSEASSGKASSVSRARSGAGSEPTAPGQPLPLRRTDSDGAMPRPRATDERAPKDNGPDLETCRCFALVVDRADPSALGPSSICTLRANTIHSFLEMNREVVAWPTALAPWGALSSGTRLGPFSLVGKDTAGATTPKNVNVTVVGAGCEIGPGAKLNQSIVMSGAKIGAESLVQHSVVGVGAKIGEKCKLMDCQVGDGYEVPDGTSAKGESFSDNAQSGQEMWW